MALDFSRNLKLAKASENKMFSTVFYILFHLLLILDQQIAKRSDTLSVVFSA